MKVVEPVDELTRGAGCRGEGGEEQGASHRPRIVGRSAPRVNWPGESSERSGERKDAKDAKDTKRNLI
jgi:hypothetical protein